MIIHKICEYIGNNNKNINEIIKTIHKTKLISDFFNVFAIPGVLC